MADENLLPANASRLEILLSQTLADTTELPSGDLIRSLYNAQTCPADLLSYLAQAVAVDQWNHRWLEQQKREVITQALEIHRTKGTPLALIRALESRGVNATLREWWQQQDPQWYLPPSNNPPGTVIVHTLLNDNIGLGEDELAKMDDAFTYAKRESIRIAHEMGLKWDESLAYSGGVAPAIMISDRDMAVSPLNPEAGLVELANGGGGHMMTLADFEFTGEI